MSKQKEFLKHHHQCVQTLCSVGLCNKGALKRKGILQLLYLLFSAGVIDKSYYKSLFDCVEQVKESELQGHYCDAAGAKCNADWQEIIDSFADAVVELKDFNIKVSKHPSKLPPFTPAMMSQEFDTYTIAAFQKTPDPNIVESDDFLRAKDLHYRVKQMFQNIKTRYPQLQSAQISILTPPSVVFKRIEVPMQPESSKMSMSQLDPFYEVRETNPQLRSITSYPDLDEIPSKTEEQLRDEKYSVAKSDIFRPSISSEFDSLPQDKDDLFRSSKYDLSEDATPEEIEEYRESLTLPPTVPVSEKSLSESLFRKSKKKSLPWWFTPGNKSKRRRSSKRKKRSKRSKTTKPKKGSRKLNMNKYVTHPASIASGSDQGGIQMYNLISTIEHSGNLRGGHYIAKCNIGQTTPNSNSWMIFNDASVHRMDPSKVITPNTYLLIYKMDEHTEKVWNKH
jgi:hypothetical protein